MKKKKTLTATEKRARTILKDAYFDYLEDRQHSDDYDKSFVQYMDYEDFYKEVFKVSDETMERLNHRWYKEWKKKWR